MNRRRRDRELARANANARDRGRDRDRELARAVAKSCARYLDLHSAKPRKLVTLAVRLLPEAQRSRYRAEFLVEMLELPDRERWGYALRVLARIWVLRRALVNAARQAER